VSHAVVTTDAGVDYRVRRVVAHSTTTDLIVLDAGIPSKNLKAIPISTRLPAVGERVLVFGSPLGLSRSVTDGIVSAVRDLADNNEFGLSGRRIQTDADIFEGSSGGPMTNMNGEVVGVVAFGYGDIPFATPSTYLAPLLAGRESGVPIMEWAGLYHRHLVQKGETLTAIARRYGIAGERIRIANGMANDTSLRADQSLIVPVEVYRVTKGDTLNGIAEIHGLELDDVLAANRFTLGKPIVPGQVLYLPLPDRDIYRVQRGDTLTSIARTFRVSAAEISQQNGLTSTRITPGDLLVIGTHVEEP
jgi:LysM repeat protein